MEHLGLSSSAPVMTGKVRRNFPDCAFCDQEGLYRCGWEEEWFVVGCSRDLKQGDRVRRFHDEKQAAPAVVEQIEDCGSFYKVLLKPPGARKYGYRSVNVQGPSFVRVARIAPCNKLVCDRHVRELDEGRYWCRDHWHSWEAMMPSLMEPSRNHFASSAGRQIVQTHKGALCTHAQTADKPVTAKAISTIVR